MNCVEFRRQLGTGLPSSDAEFARHRAECARCADAADRAAGFDRDLHRALAIEPPAHLVDSILLAQATAERRRRTTLRRGAVFALAASLALAVGVVGMRVEAKPLSALAVDHMLGAEKPALELSAYVPAESVQQAFATRGLRLSDIPSGVSYVQCCPMGKDYLSVHMVMPQANGPVTVFYIINRHANAREDFQRDGWQGRSIPLGQGTLVLLAKQTTEFERLEKTWRAALSSATAS